MRKHILSTISLLSLALAMSASAFAEDSVSKSQAEINAEASTTGHISKDAKEAWKDVKHNTKQTYEELKATFVGEEKPAEGPYVVVQTRKTATGIIGKSVYNEQGEGVAKVTDIILDNKGKALAVVVADGKFIGMGKKAAFDYNAITEIDKDGDVIMPLSKKIIDNATEFSYDKDDGTKGKHIMPVDGVSVAELLDGRLLDYKGDKVADIENLSFKGGYANSLILGFDKTLGMGGELAAMPYADVKLVRDGDDIHAQLTEKQSVLFDSYSKTITKK
jgi:sporulation protein YlmC with PRC-barrel domain